jgi:hypothetical protein
MNQDKETDIIVLTFRSQTINKKGEKKKGGRRGCKKIKRRDRWALDKKRNKQTSHCQVKINKSWN